MRIKTLLLTFVGCLALVFGCSVALVIDRSTDAFAANDLTLISSCVATPGAKIGLASGVDSCHFTEGDKIASSWIIGTPKPGTAVGVTGGTMDVYYRDVHKSYPVNSWNVSVPFSDIFGKTSWSPNEDEAIVEALLTLNWTDSQKIGHVTRFRGIAVIVVTAQGYSPMPIDSGNSAWGTTCKIQMSTAGRSAVQCR